MDYSSLNKKLISKTQKEQYIYGIVNAVPSGDTLLIDDKLITLNSITIPRLANSQRQTSDEPYAFDCWNFLRLRCIGKSVKYAITHRSNNRIYATVLLQSETDYEDLSKLMLSTGHATLYTANSTNSSLKKFEEEAKEKNLGMWSNNIENRVRLFINDILPIHVELPGIVEYIASPISMRILVNLQKGFVGTLLYLSGVSLVEGEDTGLQLCSKILNRDVLITIDIIDKNHKYYATVIFMDKGRRINISIQLLNHGFAKLAMWSLGNLSNKETYQNAENEAKIKKLGFWNLSNLSEFPSSSVAMGSTHHGKIIQVVSGDYLIIQSDLYTYTVYLSSIFAPRINRRSYNESEPYSFEAKEYVRKHFLKKKVTFTIDYIKQSEDKPRIYASVLMGKSNIGLDLVGHGLATVVNHRMNDERAGNYIDLLSEEEKARKAKLCLHSSDKFHHNFVVLSDNVLKCKQYLSILTSKKTIRAIVERVFSATRFELFLPEFSTLITFISSAVKSESEEATNYTKSLILQNEVNVSVTSLDKRCNFIGTITLLNGTILSVMLAKEGYVCIFFRTDSLSYREQLIKAENEAKQAKKGIWKNFQEDVTEIKTTVEELIIKEDFYVSMEPCSIIDSVSFYARFYDENVKFEEIERGCDTFIKNESCNPRKKGELVMCIFDEKFYRARLLRKENDKRLVKFIDYGFDKLVPSDSLFKIPTYLSSFSPLAHHCVLACCKSSSSHAHCYEAARNALIDHIWGNKFSSRVLLREKTQNDEILHVSIPSHDGRTVNSAMVNKGYCRRDVNCPKQLLDYFQSLEKDELYAKENHLNIFQYGDVDDY